MDDGIFLTCAAHPHPPWYMRPYWYFRCMWTYWFGFRKSSVETITIEVRVGGGRLRIPAHQPQSK